MVKQCYDDTVDLKSEMFFDGPASIIDVVMMEGKEEITCMHYMFDELFREQNPNKMYIWHMTLSVEKMSTGFTRE